MSTQTLTLNFVNLNTALWWGPTWASPIASSMASIDFLTMVTFSSTMPADTFSFLVDLTEVNRLLRIWWCSSLSVSKPCTTTDLCARNDLILRHWCHLSDLLDFLSINERHFNALFILIYNTKQYNTIQWVYRLFRYKENKALVTTQLQQLVTATKIH